MISSSSQSLSVTDSARALPAPTVDSSVDESWIALWTKPRAEKAVGRVLTSRLITSWLPTHRVWRQWSDRRKEVELPLFPGYIFAQSNATNWAQLLRVPGVLTVVKTGYKPAWLKPSHMAEVRYAVDRLSHAGDREVVETFIPGDRVRVVDGPMTGFVGSVRETRGSRRLLVGFEEIGRAVSIDIGSANVIALN